MNPDPPRDIAAEDRDLLEQLPHLSGSEYVIKSCSTIDYNCLAWAMGDCSQPWSAALHGGYYWPDDMVVGLPVVEVVAELFRREGYAECGDARPLPRTEKIAIYADAYREVQHVARQLPSGWWASKMGDLADIEHATLETIEGQLYGRVTMIMCRFGQTTPAPRTTPPRLILPGR